MHRLPFLHRAEQIVITEACESSDDIALSQAGRRDVARYVASRHIAAYVAERVMPTDGTAANSLGRLAHEEFADLIVAGAYGHTRWGGWIFGGVTKALLAESPVCCPLSH
jgi:nucleotide-binding universal stress UspA family protein